MCGGCHVNNSSEILMFKIISESSVSAGVRRIEAISGKKVYELIQKQKSDLEQIANDLGTREDLIENRIRAIKEEISNQKEEIKRLKSSSNKDTFEELRKAVEKKDDINLLIYKFEDATTDQMRDYENRLKQTFDNLVIVFASLSNNKLIFTVSVDDSLTNRYDAGKIVREISQLTGGNGGGRKNFAQAGGKDISKVDLALERAHQII